MTRDFGDVKLLHQTSKYIHVHTHVHQTGTVHQKRVSRAIKGLRFVILHSRLANLCEKMFLCNTDTICLPNVIIRRYRVINEHLLSLFVINLHPIGTQTPGYLYFCPNRVHAEC